VFCPTASRQLTSLQSSKISGERRLNVYPTYGYKGPEANRDQMNKGEETDYAHLLRGETRKRVAVL